MAGKGNRGITEARIEHICELMRTLAFKTGRTVKELAKQWDCTEQYCRELTAEASKRIRAELTDPDRVTAKVTTSLEMVLDNAMQGMLEGDGRSRRDAIEAAKTWAVLVGAAAPSKHQVEDVSKIPDEEVKARLYEIEKQIASRRKESGE